MDTPQVSPAETAIILELLNSCLKIPGDVVEMGCYKGDTSVLLAQALKSHRSSISAPASSPISASASSPISAPAPVLAPTSSLLPKRLWLYDSFAGLPEKSAADLSVAGSEFRAGELLASKHDLLLRFKRANLPRPIIKKAFFEDLTPADLPEKIAFAFLDGDLYSSIKTSLALVTPRLTRPTTTSPSTITAPHQASISSATAATSRQASISSATATTPHQASAPSSRGIIVVHDYANPKLPGVTRAVDEFLAGEHSFSLTRRASLAILRQ